MVRQVVPRSHKVGSVDGVDIVRWEDPSGARLVLGLRGGDVRDLVPSFAATPGARLASIKFVSDEIATAAVVDEEGEQVTGLALEFEERRLLRQPPPVTDGIAGVTALGVAVEVFDDEKAFDASPASLLDPDREPSDAPPHYVERGWKWPPRVAAESFMSYGAFSPDNPSAHARLAGTVLRSEVRTTELTGQQFVHTVVRTVGFDANVCFPLTDKGAPPVGAIVHGTVFLVGSMARDLAAGQPARRTWSGRSRR
jgi:hypothetical protein